MAKKPSQKQEPAQLLQLAQTTETWQVDAVRGRIFYKNEEDETVRPYLIIIANEDGSVLNTDLVDELPPGQRVWEQIVQAMRRPIPGAGSPRRPKQIALCKEWLREELEPKLKALNIGAVLSEALPGVQEAAAALAEHMNQEASPAPGLAGVPGVSLEMVERFYDLTEEFYDLGPWETLDDERPIEIRCPADAAPRYVVVMGGLGEEFGLAVYDQAQDILDVFDSDDPHQTALRISWMVLSYNEMSLIPFDDLDLCEEHNWPVADQDAYPAFYRISPPEASVKRRAVRETREPRLLPTTAEELAWLEGALVALIRFFDRDVRADEFGLVEPVQRSYRLNTLSGKTEISLRFPAPIGPWEQVKPSRRRRGGKLDEERLQAAMERMMRRFDAQDFDGAIDTGEALLEVLPGKDAERFAVLSMLGGAYGMIEEYDSAFRVFTQALELQPGEGAMWNNRGLAASYCGRSGQAQMDMERAVELAGKSKEARRYAHDLKEARKAVEQELKQRAPGFTLEQLVLQEDLFKRAQDCVEQDDWDEAQELVQQVIAMGDCQAEAQNLLAVCFMFRMRLQESLAALHRALEIDPDSQIARENLALIDRLEKSGKTLEEFFRDEGVLTSGSDQEQTR